MGLLGLESRKPGTPGQPNQDPMQMIQRMIEWRQQQGGGGGGPGGMLGLLQPKTDVHLVVNTRRNSILAHASPDKMAVIAKAVETIDVPSDQDRALLTNVNRMQVYRLATLDPETLVKTLQDTGDLDPTTQLQVDKKHKSIIAYASLADHMTIRTLVQKLDGSSRRFEVVKLHRLAADYVAGSITFMMGTEEPKEERSRSSGWGWNPWGGSDRRQTEETDQDKFRVEADVENNRLLLWANEVEMTEVKNLLVKLGEISGPGGNPERVRVLDLEPGETTQQLLERIRRTWPSLAPNKLVLPPATGAAPGEPAVPRQENPVAPPPSINDRRAETPPPEHANFRFAQFQAGDSGETRPTPPAPATPAPATQENPSAASQEAPPIHVSVDEEGRLVISSQDTEALDALEDLINQMAPPRKDYKQFKLRYATAYWMKLNLEDYFREEKKEDKTTSRRPWFLEPPPAEPKKASNRLSKRRQMKFIDDYETNTLLVVGATAEQLRNVEELIAMWDIAPPKTSESARMTSVVPIRYSKAQTVAETVKEVYRDLLSSNDKALQGANSNRRPQNQNTYIFGEAGGGDSERRTQVTFKGKLSIGVDEVSNTLIVSTEGQNLMDNVTKMIESLDQAAIPTTDVRVVTLNGSMNPDSVRAALAKILGQTTGGSASPQFPGGQMGAGQQGFGRRGAGTTGGNGSGGRGTGGNGGRGGGGSGGGGGFGGGRGGGQ